MPADGRIAREIAGLIAPESEKSPKLIIIGTDDRPDVEGIERRTFLGS